MKIALIHKNTNINIGSYRMWIHDLHIYLNQIGYKTVINPKDVSPYDIIIYGKGMGGKQKSNKKIGIINPACDNKSLIQIMDFIIVGSIEERESIIQYNKNCFIFPLIENMYQNIQPKIHEKKDKITIGYHGNPNHLNHMALGLSKALERLSNTFNIELVILESQLNSLKNNWIQGKPKIPIRIKKWNFKTLINDIQEFDIGIVPNISDIVHTNKLKPNMTLGKYNTDIMIRFKNKSNNGRTLVLCQLGIPVVADITPSNMHILANPDNGYGVLSEEGWYQALIELLCEKNRNFISQNAYKECSRLYNPLEWAKKLVKSIENI